ncbi:hypothetical protein [Shewanella colwelliana]|uniref:hypothetical protein n=1 Tax=Shewanella colwelliana TaxID=23 RepID=UPI0022B0152F|nr:hypothetical protein [Shewanella colwelliana]MCZ4337652.1 hypothetical protein [Shewanella colwelliana]
MATNTGDLAKQNAAAQEALQHLQAALQCCTERGLTVWCDQVMVTTAELCENESLIELA